MLQCVGGNRAFLGIEIDFQLFCVDKLFCHILNQLIDVQQKLLFLSLLRNYWLTLHGSVIQISVEFRKLFLLLFTDRKVVAVDAVLPDLAAIEPISTLVEVGTAAAEALIEQQL